MRVVHRLANLNWVAVFLLPLMVILMEVFWVYPWLVWAGKWPELDWQRSPLSLASLILIIGISFLITRLFVSRRWSLWWIQSAIITCGIVAIFVVIRIEYSAGYELLSGQWFVHTVQVLLDSFSHPHPIALALIVAGYFWWRGISRGSSPLHFNDIYRFFLVGLVALVALIVIWGVSLGASALESLVSTAGFYVAGFFFFGLAALTLSHLQTIQKRMLQEETARVFNRRWLSIMLGVIGGITLVAVGITSIFSGQFVALLGRFLNNTFELLLRALDYLLIPVGYLVAGLVYVGQWLVSLIASGERPQPFEAIDFSDLGELPEGASPQMLPTEVMLAIKWGFFALVMIAVIYLVARAISRYRASRARTEIEEIHESLWSWDGFKADLHLFFSLIWQRFRRQKKGLVPVSPVPRWYTDDDVEGRLNVRQIYRRLLWEASRSGIARRRYETPYEYARRLGQDMPAVSEPVSELTDLYIDVRYGELEAGDKQLDYANRLWQALKRRLRRPERDQSNTDT